MAVDDSTKTYLDEYKATGDEHALMAAFSAAKDALARTPPSDPAYPERLNTMAQAFFTLFELAGNFAALDGAVSVLRRLSALPAAPSYQLPERISVRNDQWADTIVTRDLSDHWWAIHHPGGRVSWLGKNWDQWTGEGWPMGWTIQDPDGNRLSFDENHFGDGWVLVGDDGPSAAPDAEAVTGTAGIGKDRYSYTASAEGFSYEPIEKGKPGHVPAPVAVLRVMPMTETEAFVMFAHGVDAEDVYLTMKIWAEDPVQKAADVGAALGARVFVASD